MKKMIIAGLLAIGLMTSSTQETNAQVQVNINIGQQPLWGPVGYDYVEYYYIPELNVYYDVLNAMYIYHQHRRWVHAAVLPSRFGHYDLYRMHKIVMNQMNPFRYNHDHIRSYGNYRRMQHQMAIRDARDYRYFAHPRHPRHNEYRGNNHYSNTQRGNSHYNQRGPRYQETRTQQRPNDRNYGQRGTRQQDVRQSHRSNENYSQRRNEQNRSEQRGRSHNNNVSQRTQRNDNSRQFVERRSERNNHSQQNRSNNSRNSSNSRESSRR